MIGVLGPNLAASIGLDPKNLIVVVLPLGLGVVGGVFGLRQLGAGVSRRRTAEGGLIAFGLLALLMAALGLVGGSSGLPIVPLVAVLGFIAGAAYASTTVSAQTALFEHMPPAARGRIFGVLASIVSAASLFPILVAGPLADRTSGPVVIALASGGVLLVTAWSATLFGPRRSPEAPFRPQQPPGPAAP